MSTEMTKEEIFSRVRELLVGTFELEPSDILPTAHLIDDLDLDSIDAIDLAVDLERETGISIQEDELREVRVVQDVIDLIHRRLGQA